MSGVTRNEINKGDEVYVVQHIADGVPPKRMRARVVVVMRKAAKVRFLDKDKAGRKGERTIRFSELERIPPASSTSRPSKAPSDAHKPPPPPAAPVDPTPASDAAVGKRRAARHDDDTEEAVEAWLAMGRELLEPVKAELLAIDDETQVLNEEAAFIERALDELAVRRKDVAQKLRRLERVVEATR